MAKVLHCKVTIPHLTITDGGTECTREDIELDFFGQVDENDQVAQDYQLSSCDTPFGVLTIGLHFGTELPPE